MLDLSSGLRASHVAYITAFSKFFCFCKSGSPDILIFFFFTLQSTCFVNFVTKSIHLFQSLLHLSHCTEKNWKKLLRLSEIAACEHEIDFDTSWRQFPQQV